MKKTKWKTLLMVVVGSCFGACLSRPAAGNLVAYYSFATDLTNSSTLAGPDATDVGGVAAGVPGGIAGNALELETENNEHINVPLSFGTGNTLGEEFSISTWYKLNAVPATNTSGRYFIFEDDTAFQISYGLRDSTGVAGFNDTQTFTSSTNQLYADVYTPGEWQHVVQTYTTDGTTTTITTFIDGVQRGSITNLTANVVGTGINFGAPRSTVTNRGFDGFLDEIAIWDNAISPAAVTAVYNQGLSGLPIPLPSLGDANNDGVIDELDFFLISDNLSNVVPLGTLGDLDVDGQVTFNDFRIWKDNAPAAALLAAGFTVPEPAAAMLLGTCLLATAVPRGRRR
jgi:hypothetical protein